MNRPVKRRDPKVIAAVVADYRDGVPVKTIAARHHVSLETVRSYAREAGLERREGKTGLCRVCMNRAQLYIGVCGQCRAEIPLTGGQWVLDPRTRVQVWMPDPVVMDAVEWRRLDAAS